MYKSDDFEEMHVAQKYKSTTIPIKNNNSQPLYGRIVQKKG